MNKGIVIFVCLGLLLVACKNKHEVESYYSKAEQDSLLADIITYVYVKPPGSDWKTRFEPTYRKYYVDHIQDFQFKNYFIHDNGIYYFYLIRPARGPKGNIRGVGGSFRLNEEGTIVSFKEIFNTPIGTQEELDAKGSELFKWMTLHGNVKEYLKNPDYIEWPDKMTYYDTLQHEWLIRPGI